MVGLTRLPTEEVTEILSQVSRMVPKKGWEFLLPYDAEFVSRFPEVVQRQTLLLEMRNQQQTRQKSVSDGKDAPLKPPATTNVRRRSRNMSISSDNDSGAEADNSRGRRGNRSRRNSSRSDVGIPTKVET